jgi:hypothetical protein
MILMLACVVQWLSVFSFVSLALFHAITARRIALIGQYQLDEAHKAFSKSIV